MSTYNSATFSNKFNVTNRIDVFLTFSENILIPHISFFYLSKSMHLNYKKPAIQKASVHIFFLQFDHYYPSSNFCPNGEGWSRGHHK